MAFEDELVDLLAGSTTLVATGVDRAFLPAVLRAHERTLGEAAGASEETDGSSNVSWRLRSPTETVEGLGREFVLGTKVATRTESGSMAIVTAAEAAAGDLIERTLFLTDREVHAVTGPVDNRTVITTDEMSAVRGLREAMGAQFERSPSAAIDMPSRDRLYRTAGEQLCGRFAADLEVLLDDLEPGALDRSRTVTDRTLLLALGARHDHLFQDVRAWAESVGIAPRQTFTADRRMLVASGVIEEVKVPLGVGHPNYRLRAIEEGLLRLPPERLIEYLRDRLDGIDRAAFDGPDAADRYFRTPHGPGDDDRPVWERHRRR
ncbi:transcriptional regulator TbsP domain-containing protein [Halorubrum vacuolatum]|uniref:Uncharacterized protein n=1 Tax=Halorubrum vacuolatum TaxID=63740 RepID=A0A238WLU3_HALVU|nr:DUF5821 family protein [Halorubrum vacuolatum]SNR47556.1 hypothetical protein SAMN06264855_108141 [Halorubrum vacuolatum]